MITIEKPIQKILKRAAKRAFDELKGRNDYEIKIVEVQCVKCGGEDRTSAYKFYGETEWNVNRKSFPCNKCQDIEYLKNYQRNYRVKVGSDYVVLCDRCLHKNSLN